MRMKLLLTQHNCCVTMETACTRECAFFFVMSSMERKIPKYEFVIGETYYLEFENIDVHLFNTVYTGHFKKDDQLFYRFVYHVPEEEHTTLFEALSSIANCHRHMNNVVKIDVQKHAFAWCVRVNYDFIDKTKQDVDDMLEL